MTSPSRQTVALARGNGVGLCVVGDSVGGDGLVGDGVVAVSEGVGVGVGAAVGWCVGLLLPVAACTEHDSGVFNDSISATSTPANAARRDGVRRIWFSVVFRSDRKPTTTLRQQANHHVWWSVYRGGASGCCE